MKKILVYGAVIFNLLAFFSCGGSSTSLEAEADSLRLVSKQQQELLDDLTSTVVELSANLDSIKYAEGLIASGIDENGQPFSKKTLLAKLDGLKLMVGEKKSQLVYLEEKVNTNNGEISKLKNVIEFLNSELAQKDKIIDELRTELSSKNADIISLTSKLNAKEEEISSLSSEVQNKEEQIRNQSASINEVFYVIGTKSELQEKGLLSGNGLFQKKKVNLSNFDSLQFVKADMRTLNTIEIPAAAKKVSVMTGNPSSSYSIEDVDKTHSVLHISDAKSFWSTIKYLIIKIS